MQIESLKVFCDLAETKSFTKAAQINNVTQSAVSQTISALERRFNSLLIERSKKNFRLTPEGEVFYDYSKRILQTCDALHSKLQEIEDVISGNIRVATIYSIGLHVLPPYVKKFLKRYPIGQCARGVSARQPGVRERAGQRGGPGPGRLPDPRRQAGDCPPAHGQAGPHLPSAASLRRAEVDQGQGAERAEVHQLRAGHPHAARRWTRSSRSTA